MSTANVTAFFQKMQTDDDLKKQFTVAQSELQQQMMNQLVDKIVDLGSAHSYDFDATDLRVMYNAMTDQMSENRELSDDEVNAIAGGKTAAQHGAALKSAITLGIYCAIASIVGETKEGTSCAAWLTLNKESQGCS